MLQPKVFKYILFVVSSLFVVIGFVFIKSNAAYGEERCSTSTQYCGASEECSFCTGGSCTCPVVCQTCYTGREVLTTCWDPLIPGSMNTTSSGCDSDGWCDNMQDCPSGGCYNDSDCPTDDGCTDYSCYSEGYDVGVCQSTDLCGGGGGGGTPTPTPGGNPYFNVDIVQASGIVSIEQGQVATYDINIAPYNNYSGTVNLTVSGCPATATCAFSASSVAFTNDSPDPGTSVLTVSNTTNVIPGAYPFTVTGTDTAPEPDLIDSDNSDLTVAESTTAICDSEWHNIPSSYGYSGMNFTVTQDNSGVFKYRPVPWDTQYYSGGLVRDKCTFGLGNGVCLWQSNRISMGDFSASQAYAQDANNIFVGGYTGYYHISGFLWLSDKTYLYSPPSSITDMGNTILAKPWGTPTSVTDKDGRVWNFQYLDYPFYKSQYKCGLSPNQATCNGTWQSMPGGGNTPSQPVGIQLGSVYSDKIGFVMRGTDNQTYYRTCDFSGSECNFNNSWTSIGGSPYYSPRTFFGADWDFNIKDIGKTYWAKFLHSIPINTWSDWENRGLTDEPWGTPYRFNDKLGRTWQLQRKANNTIEYACGANVCITPAFDASKSSVSPTTVNVNDNVTIRCDMGVYGMDGITASFTGGQNVSPGGYDGYDVTTAKFTFKATQAGTHTVNCNTSVTGQNFCASSNSAGTLTVVAPNQPPTVPSVTVTEPDYCSSGPAAYINWTYSDPDGDPQSAYQVQVSAGGSSWNPPLSFDSGKVSGSGTSYFANGLPFDKTIKARVRVWDSHDSVSGWTESASWKTPKHAYPFTDFIYTPSTDIPAKQPVQFTDQTTFYDGGGGTRIWSWAFGDGGTSNVQNPSPHTYNLPGLYNSSLTATDKDNYSCSRTKPVTVAQPVPVWKEVSPR